MSEELKSPTSPKIPLPVKAVSVNDVLSLERTAMANERTMLAYVRTSLAILVVGVTIIKFFASQGMIILGWGLLIAGVAVLTFGLMRFHDIWQKLRQMAPANYKLLSDED
jgi:putative membrane protein